MYFFDCIPKKSFLTKVFYAGLATPSTILLFKKEKKIRVVDGVTEVVQSNISLVQKN